MLQLPAASGTYLCVHSRPQIQFELAGSEKSMRYFHYLVSVVVRKLVYVNLLLCNHFANWNQTG